MAKPNARGSAPGRSQTRGFSGSAEGLSLEQLLELVRLRRLTAVLTVNGADGNVGELRCRQGQLVGGSIAGVTGPGAIARVLSIPGGDVKLELDAPAEPRGGAHTSPAGGALAARSLESPSLLARPRAGGASPDRRLPFLQLGDSPRQQRARRGEPRHIGSSRWLLVLPLVAVGAYALGARQGERRERPEPRATSLELRPAEPPRGPTPPRGAAPLRKAEPIAPTAPSSPSAALERPRFEPAATRVRGPEPAARLDAPLTPAEASAAPQPSVAAPRVEVTASVALESAAGSPRARPRAAGPRPAAPAARAREASRAAAPPPSAPVSSSDAPPAEALPRVRILEDERPKARVLE